MLYEVSLIHGPIPRETSESTSALNVAIRDTELGSSVEDAESGAFQTLSAAKSRATLGLFSRCPRQPAVGVARVWGVRHPWVDRAAARACGGTAAKASDAMKATIETEMARMRSVACPAGRAPEFIGSWGAKLDLLLVRLATVGSSWRIAVGTAADTVGSRHEPWVTGFDPTSAQGSDRGLRWPFGARDRQTPAPRADARVLTPRSAGAAFSEP